MYSPFCILEISVYFFIAATSISVLLKYSFTNKYRNCPVGDPYRVHKFYQNYKYGKCEIKLTRWFEIATYVKEHSECTRADIRKAFNIIDCNLFTTMLHYGIIKYYRAGRTYKYCITTRGMNCLNAAEERGEALRTKLVELNKKRPTSDDIKRKEVLKQIRAKKAEIRRDAKNAL